MNALDFLVFHLEMQNDQVGAFIISSFTEYAFEFLLRYPDVLYPNFAHIKARIRLNMTHRSVGWLCTQGTPPEKQCWRQEEYATSFLLHVLDYLYKMRYIPEGRTIDDVVRDTYRRLCILQSVFLGNAVWIENTMLQAKLRNALIEAMGNLRYYAWGPSPWWVKPMPF
jgi:hypothetical protein